MGFALRKERNHPIQESGETVSAGNAALENVHPGVVEGGLGGAQSWSATTAPTRQTLVIGTLLILMQCLDGIFTSIGVARFGIGIEGNPLLRYLMMSFGEVETLAVLKTIAVLMVILLTMVTKQLPWVKNAMLVLTHIYLITAIIPWTYILFF